MNKDSNPFMKVSIDLGNEESPEWRDRDLRDDLAISTSDINQSYLDQPGKYAWWSTMANRARALADRLKVEYERQDDYIRKTLTGKLDAQVRKQLELDGEKITESKVTNAINQNPEYVVALERYYDLRAEWVEANEDATILETAREAMNQRKDMLISLGATLRMDMNNADLYLKKYDEAEFERKKEQLKATRKGVKRKPIISDSTQ